MEDSKAEYIPLQPRSAGEPGQSEVNIDALAAAFARRLSHHVASGGAQPAGSAQPAPHQPEGTTLKKMLCYVLKDNIWKALIILATIATSTLTAYLINNSQMQGKLAEMQGSINAIDPKIELLQAQVTDIDDRLPAISRQLTAAAQSLALINKTLAALHVETLATDIQKLRATATSVSADVLSAQQMLLAFNRNLSNILAPCIGPPRYSPGTGHFASCGSVPVGSPCSLFCDPFSAKTGPDPVCQRFGGYVGAPRCEPIWTQATCSSCAARQIFAANFQNNVVLAGGSIGGCLTPLSNSVLIASLSNATLSFTSQPTPSWSPRSYTAMNALGGWFYVMGGWLSGSSLLNEVWRTADLRSWSQIANAPWSPRHAMASVVFQGRIVLLGGWSSGQNNDVWAFDGNTWASLTASAQWSPRQGLAAVVFHDAVFLSGGASGNSNFQADTWFSRDCVNWRFAGSFSSAGRARHSMVVFNDKMYIFGGYNSAGSLNDVYVSTSGQVTTSTVS